MHTKTNSHSGPLSTFINVQKSVDDFFNTLSMQTYRMHEVLYAFSDEDLVKAITLAQSCVLPKHYASYKDYICEKIAQKLNFGSNDLVLFIEGGVYAKLFFQIESENAEDRRACGLSPELLKKYSKEFFPKQNYKESVFELLPFALEEVLSFKKINPLGFKKLFIPTLVNLVEIIVIEESKCDNLHIIRGLTFFLLRDMFDDLMLFIAEDLLFHFSNNDKKAIEFLSFFSVHESIDTKGNRYKPNPILDESNHAWNITTIRSTMIQHKKAKQSLYDKKNMLLIIKKKLEALKLEKKSFLKQNHTFRNDLFTTEERIKALHKTIQKLHSTDALEVQYTENNEEKIFPKSLLLGKLLKKEDVFLSEKTALRRGLEEGEAKLSNKQKEIDTWEKKFIQNNESLAAIETSGHPIDKQYLRIQRALAKTLASR